MKKLLFIILVFCLCGKIFSQNNSLSKRDTSKTKVMCNGFVGGGAGLYNGVGVGFPGFIFNASFKAHYKFVTVWAFAQYMQNRINFRNNSKINSDGLFIGPGLYKNGFSLVAGGGLGAVASKEFHGANCSPSHGCGSPYTRGYEFLGWGCGFHMAFKGENTRFSLQFNMVKTSDPDLFSLVILGCEFGKR